MQTRTENITVAVRFRPYNKKEDTKESDFLLKIEPAKKSIDISENSKEIQQFMFDHVFDNSVNQEKIFNAIAKNAIDWVCQGYNATIFAYGSTGTGKSFTMFGNEDGKSNPGIIPRACDALFQKINSNEEVAEANMKCSFLEIYREKIKDLLNPGNTEELKIRQSPVLGPYVQGLTEKYVYSPAEILNTIKEGTAQRSTATTALNNVSSRSHAVVTLRLAQIFSDGSEVISKLNLVDLAGSENVSKSEVQGITLTEAQTINKSLSCLGNVICALTEKGRDHIPYRDSKLTFLLQDSLGGNSKTILIATASPSSSSYSETLNTLKFAKRAKEIKNIPKVNRNESSANLLKTIELLNKKIDELEKRCEESKIIIQAVEHPKDEKDSQEVILLRTKCERLEKKILGLEEILKKDEDRNNQMKELFEKQRELSQSIAKDLYNERIKNCILSNELEQYKLFYQSMKEAVSKPEILSRIVSKTTITKSSSETAIILQAVNET